MDSVASGGNDLLSRDYWLSRAPDLHIASPERCAGLAPINFVPEQVPALHRLLVEEGYLQISFKDWQIDMARMAEVVRALDAEGLSPVFAFIYDEFWIPLFQLHEVYREFLGGDYAVLPDFWIWNVDPKRGDAGWRPHRDKNRHALFPDGRPKSLSTWIPLTPATTLNGCMYIVPAHLDRSYNTPDEDNWKFDLPAVRALPAQPGDFFIWNQALLHWGSQASTRGGESRISIAFETQRADIPPMNQPLMAPLQLLNFEGRIKLICKQILQYRHMYKVDPRVEALAFEVLGPDAVRPRVASA